jgi:hypothetical protein
LVPGKSGFRCGAEDVAARDALRSGRCSGSKHHRAERLWCLSVILGLVRACQAAQRCGDGIDRERDEAWARSNRASGTALR